MNVLIFEPNAYHFETLPGFSRLFLDLGYDVTILVQRHDDIGNEFCLFDDIERNRIRFIFYDKSARNNALARELDSHRYDYLFISSFDCYEDKTFSVLNLEDIIRAGITFGGCCHILSNLKLEDELKLVLDGRVSALTAYDYCGRHIPMIMPSYFGSRCQRHEKNEKCRIVSIGMASDHINIEDAAKYLNYSHRQLELVYIGYTIVKKNLKYFIKLIAYPVCRRFNIGRYGAREKKPASLKTHFLTRYLGKLKFEDMFDEVRNSDFILADLDNTEDGKYYTVCTSGSKALSLGLNTPLIISEKTAKAYGFDDSTAVIFPEGSIDKALEKAVGMSREEYEEMCVHLSALSDKIRYESGNNLKHFI